MFVQRPATLLGAKRIVEELELTQSMVNMHQTKEKEKTTKNTQHRGTQGRRSERVHQSFQFRNQKMKTCSSRDRGQTQKTDLGTFGCISAQKGAKDMSYPEIHG